MYTEGVGYLPYAAKGTHRPMRFDLGDNEDLEVSVALIAMTPRCGHGLLHQGILYMCRRTSGKKGLTR